MTKSVITAAMLPLILTGCLSVTPKKTEPPKPVEPVETASQIAQASVDFPGTYRTRLKCEGCDYTNAQLQVSRAGYYRYIEQGMKNGAPISQPIVFQGRFTWDKNAPIIRLLNARNMHFFVAENQMVLLDHPVTSYAELTSEPKFQKVER